MSLVACVAVQLGFDQMRLGGFSEVKLMVEVRWAVGSD